MVITLHNSRFAFILFVCFLCVASALIRLASANSRRQRTSGGSRFLNGESGKLQQERGKVAIASAVQSLRQRRD